MATKAELQERLDELALEVSELKDEVVCLAEENGRLEDATEILEGQIATAQEESDAQRDFRETVNALIEFVDFHRPSMDSNLRRRFERISFLRSLARE